jgi:hypothetical protein
MSRVIAIGPGGRAQAPVRRDVCRPVIEYVIMARLLDRKLLSPVCTSLPRAAQLRLDLYRSARYFCDCGMIYCTRKYKNTPPHNGCPRGGQRISCVADVVMDDKGNLRVQFQLFDKREAMRRMIQRYGPDPNKWPYNPNSKQLKRRTA